MYHDKYQRYKYEKHSREICQHWMGVWSPHCGRCSTDSFPLSCLHPPPPPPQSPQHPTSLFLSFLSLHPPPPTPHLSQHPTSLFLNFSVVFESQIPNSTLRRRIFMINTTTSFHQLKYMWNLSQILTDFDKSLKIWLKFHRYWGMISGGEWCYI